MMHVLHNQFSAHSRDKEVIDDDNNADEVNKEENDERRAAVKDDSSLETPTRKVIPSKRKLKRTIKQSELSESTGRKKLKIIIQS